MLNNDGLKKALQVTLASVVISFSGLINAGEADVVDVAITKTSNGDFRVAPDGTVLGSRVLAHPHDNEQPFTRSLTLSIPANIKTVTIRANDSVHELGGKEMQVTVPH